MKMTLKLINTKSKGETMRTKQIKFLLAAVVFMMLSGIMNAVTFSGHVTSAEDGSDVANANVICFIMPDDSTGTGNRPESTTTDVSGNFTFYNINDGSNVMLEVSHGDFLLFNQNYTVNGNMSVDIALSTMNNVTTYSVSGVVIDSLNNQPVPNLNIILGGSLLEIAYNAVTDANGAFSFAEVISQEYDIYLGNPNFIPPAYHITVDQDLNLTLYHTPANTNNHVVGTIVDENGNPVPHLPVAIAGNLMDVMYLEQTNNNGVVHFNDVVTQPYNVYLGPRNPMQVPDAVINVDGDNQFTAVFGNNNPDTMYTVTINIVDENNAPVQFTQFVIAGQLMDIGYNGITDNMGTAVITGVIPQPYNLYIGNHGPMVNPDASFIVDSDTLITVVYTDTVMTDTYTLSGDVIDFDTNQPLQGIEIVISYRNPWNQDSVVLTDAAGHFNVDSLSAGRYFVSITDPAYNVYMNEVILDQDINLSIPLHTFAGGDITFSGSVFNARTGMPVDGINVTLTEIDSNNTTENYSVVTDYQGQFVIDNMTAGNYEVTLMLNGMMLSYQIVHINHSRHMNFPVRVIQIDAPVLSGRVMDFNRNPVVNAAVEIYCEFLDCAPETVYTDNRGFYNTDQVINDEPYIVTVQETGYLPFEGRVFVNGDTRFDVRLIGDDMVINSSVSGTVISDDTSNPVSNAVVHLIPENGGFHNPFLTAMTDVNGQYTINVPAGNYMAVCHVRNVEFWNTDSLYINYYREFYDDTQEIETAQLITVGDDQDVSGIDFGVPDYNSTFDPVFPEIFGLLDTDDRTNLQIAQITLKDTDNNILAQTTSGDDGRFSFEGAREGNSYTVIVELDGYETQTIELTHYGMDSFLSFDMEAVIANDPVNEFEELSLGNYPNPFNPETTINYSLTNDERVEISIYNLKGQKVKTLINGHQTAGKHEVMWNGTNNSNNPVASGVYFTILKTSKETLKHKVLLLK